MLCLLVNLIRLRVLQPFASAIPVTNTIKLQQTLWFYLKIIAKKTAQRDVSEGLKHPQLDCRKSVEAHKTKDLCPKTIFHCTESPSRMKEIHCRRSLWPGRFCKVLTESDEGKTRYDWINLLGMTSNLPDPSIVNTSHRAHARCIDIEKFNLEGILRCSTGSLSQKTLLIERFHVSS